MRTHLFRGVSLLIVLLLISVVPAAAQSLVRGKVVDAQGTPVDGATVTFEAEGSNRKMQTKTNKNGEFLQIGLQSGGWKVTAAKDGVGTDTKPAQVSQGRPVELAFTLSPAGAAAAAAADKEAAAAIQASAGAAIEAMKAGRHDDAIKAFNEVVAKVPTCADCYYSLGIAYSAKQQHAEAEAAFKKVIELKPDSADAYTGLATLYNSQKKFAEAAEASAKAAQLSAAAGGGGNAEAIYNQGVILWNAGKYAEAKEQYEAAIKADPTMAMAYYQLGMANLNLGQLPAAIEAFEGYLKVDPEGPKSGEVKGFIAQLKK